MPAILSSAYEKAAAMLAGHPLLQLAAVQAEGVLWHRSGSGGVLLYPDSLGMVSALVARGVKLMLLCAAGQSEETLQHAEQLLKLSPQSGQVLALELPAAGLQLAPAIPDPSCHVEACTDNRASTSSHAPAATSIPEPLGSIVSPAQRAQCQTAARNTARAMRQAAGVSARGTLLFVTARCLLLPPAAHAHIAARQVHEAQRDEQADHANANANVTADASASGGAGGGKDTLTTAHSGVLWCGPGGPCAVVAVACHHALGLGTAQLQAALEMLAAQAHEDQGY